MNRFLVFAGDHYYPYGGWSDFQGSDDDLEEAIDRARSYGDWSHVVAVSGDNAGKIVWSSSGNSW